MKKKDFQMNIGGASILLVLLVFAVTVFAILSMRASYHELKMSEKTRDSVEQYYEVDAKSEEALLSIQEVMYDAMKQTEMEEIEYFKKEIAKDECFTFDEISHVLTCLIAVDYNKNVETKLKIADNFEDGYEILSHKLLVNESDNYENDGIDIWDGVIDD